MSIEEIKNRHINKSWKVGYYSTDYYKQGYQVLTENDGVVAECIDDSEEAEFIAHAPADIAYLLEQNQRLVEALDDSKSFFQEILTKLNQSDDIKEKELVTDLIANRGIHEIDEVLQAYKLLEKKD